MTQQDYRNFILASMILGITPPVFEFILGGVLWILIWSVRIILGSISIICMSRCQSLFHKDTRRAEKYFKVGYSCQSVQITAILAGMLTVLGMTLYDTFQAFR